MTATRHVMRGPRPIIPFRVLEIALIVLVAFPFSIFVIRSREQVLSRRIGDERSTTVQLTSAADVRARLKALRSRPRSRPASIIIVALIIPLFWIAVFGVIGRRLFALRI